MVFVGLVLAAGAGTRLGTPKALLRDADGTPWLERSFRALTDGGCSEVVVVLGADAAQAEPLVPANVRVVIAEDWAEGIAASLRAGLRALDNSTATVIAHVDVPELPPTVVERLLAGADETTIRQATYRGKPGHPVVLGRHHWAGVAEAVTGDSGARRWLLAHGVEEVDCSDLFDGADIDTPAQLAARPRRTGPAG
jgi:CTP:molybdopterin cytidylyltransferase MocA